MAIDATARIADGARVADGADVGPYCIVGPNVVLEPRVRLIGHVNVSGVTKIGVGTLVYPFCSLGTPPQSVHYRGGPTKLIIGAHCELREHVTINTGTEAGGGVTAVGEGCLLMVGAHVGHDCTVGNNVTFANNAMLGGHVSIGNDVFLGGQCAVHQFVRIGEGAMVAGLSGIAADIIPFGFALGQVATLVGLNTVGLRRRGATRADLHALRRAYQAMFLGGGVLADRIRCVARDFADDPLVGKIVAFTCASGKRPLMQPRMKHEGGERDDDEA